MQAGLNYSPISFKNIIPNEIWGDLMENAMNYISKDGLGQHLQDFQLIFPFMNYKNKDITPPFKSGRRRNVGNELARPISIKYVKSDIESDKVLPRFYYSNINGGTLELLMGKIPFANDGQNNQVRSHLMQLI